MCSISIYNGGAWWVNGASCRCSCKQVLAGQPAAVYHEDVAVDPHRSGAAQEDHHAGHVFGPAPTPGRNAHADLLAAHRIGYERYGLVGGNVAGRDRVHV